MHNPTILISILLVSVVSFTIQQRDPHVSPEIMAYRRAIAQSNFEMIQKHNSNPLATFKMYPYPKFMGLSNE
jgi:hypothetical protein